MSDNNYTPKYTKKNPSSNNKNTKRNTKISLSNDSSELTRILCTCLESKQFNVDSAVAIINELKNKKLIYSEISNRLFVTSKDNVANFLSNIELLKEHITNSHDANDKEIEHIVLKLYDHTQLANHQINVFKIGKEELDTHLKSSEFISSKIETLTTKVDNTINSVNSKFDDAVDTINTKFDNKTELISSKVDEKIESVNSQVVSLVALFTAMSFLVFGGLSSFESIFSNIQEVSLLKLIILSSVWGFAILNTIAVFMFFTSRVVGKSFKIINHEEDTLFKRYPYIILSNYILLFIFLIASWMYLYVKKFGYHLPKSFVFPDSLIQQNVLLLLIILSFIIILLLILGYIFFIHKRNNIDSTKE